MSSQNPATFETALLLEDTRPAGLSRERFRFSLLIPVALATNLAALIPSTTIVDLIRHAVCKFWHTTRGDPVGLPAGGLISPELCDAPEIEQYFATIIAIQSATECILTMALCGITTRISSYYGRKPAFFLVLTAGTMGNYLIPVSQYTPNWPANWVFLMGTLLRMFSGPFISAYLAHLYIVDVCVPEDRTAALSEIAGWAALGGCISYALGGTITTKTSNPLIVFYLAATIFLVTFIYVFSVLPESFSVEQRNALSLKRLESSPEGLSTTPLAIFEPLKMLIPTRNLDGNRNWRLACCAAHTSLFAAANVYALPAWFVLVTSKYHLTPADTGLFLTVSNVSGTIVLALIVPPLVRFLRPYYRRKIVRSPPAEDDMSSSEEIELETSDRLDVHLAFVSCVITAVFYLSAAASSTTPALIFSGIFIGFTSIHTPTIRSLVAGSVDPLKQGEALAAIEMVSQASSTLSPIVMGSILTATINTTPLLAFYIHLIIVLTSSVLLFLVRDVDGYRKPPEA